MTLFCLIAHKEAEHPMSKHPIVQTSVRRRGGKLANATSS